MIVFKTYSEAGFEAVERRPVRCVLVPSFAEQQGVFVQEEVSLHGFEPGHFLHSHSGSFVADPHTEVPLHQHSTQLTQVALATADRTGSNTG